jgi:hypothetical protein
MVSSLQAIQEDSLSNRSQKEKGNTLSRKCCMDIIREYYIMRNLSYAEYWDCINSII